MSTIKVILADDYRVVRDGLRRLIELDNELEVIGEATSGHDVIAKAVSLSPDVITMDLKMPGMDGIAATREIKRKMPGVKVLAVTLYAEELIGQALEAGVSGYLIKDSDFGQITQAIHQVYDGLCPIAPSLTRELVTAYAESSRNNCSSLLTERQKEVLRLIAEAVSIKEIGSHLLISTSVIKSEIGNIFDKLEVNDRPYPVFQAVKQQFI